MHRLYNGTCVGIFHGEARVLFRVGRSSAPVRSDSLTLLSTNETKINSLLPETTRALPEWPFTYGSFSDTAGASLKIAHCRNRRSLIFINTESRNDGHR